MVQKPAKNKNNAKDYLKTQKIYKSKYFYKILHLAKT